MGKYITRRFLQLVLIIFIANSLVFLLPFIVDSDLKNQLHGEFPKLLGKEYIQYWWNLAHLDFGRSQQDWPTSVMDKISSALPWTLGFMTTSTCLSFLLGSFLGAVLVWPGSPRFLQVLTPFLMSFSAVPFYYLALGVTWIFAVELRWFPPGGGYDPTLIVGFNWITAINIIYHAVLPSLTLMLWGIGTWALTMRASVVNVLGEDYITYSLSKGLREWTVFINYGVRNALLPQMTNLSIQLSMIIGGSVVLESMFNYPGIGTLVFNAINSQDYPMIYGCTFFLILCSGVSLFIVDILYPLVDPRICYER